MKLPKDKNGLEIQAGGTIRMTFNARQREYSGRRRVAEEGMSGRQVILPDEGGWKTPTVEWVEFSVKWSGACLIAERTATSDFQAVMSGDCVSITTGKSLSSSTAMHYLNAAFNGADFEVM